MTDAGRLVNEFEAYFYEFSPRGFTDGVYNAVIESWAESVEQVLLKDSQLASVAHIEGFQKSLLGILFKTDSKFKEHLKKFTDFALRYVFRIPTSVTLPEHVNLQRLLVEEQKTGERFRPTKVEKECKPLENQIVEMRFALAELESQICEVDDVLKVLEAMENACTLKEFELSQIEESKDETINNESMISN